MRKMIKEIMKCPVCGKENEYEYYSEYGWGTVEQHYYCDRCTYFLEQAYGHPVAGISTDCPEEYLWRVKEFGLDIYESEDIP